MAQRDEIQDKAQIQAALREAVGAVADWVAAQPEARFAAGPPGRWTMGQHVDHLVRSLKPLTSGMRLPKVVLRLALGTADGPSRDYATIRANYEATLDAGGKASGKFLPPDVPAARKAALLAALRKQGDTLVRQLDRWTEADLDRAAAPHPLLGKLSLREILFFTIHHHDHHLETLKRDYAG